MAPEETIEAETTLEVQSAPVKEESVSAETTITAVQEEVTVATEETETEEAALKIQAAFRGMQAREQVKAMKAEKVTRHAITGLHVETLGGATQVALCPRELSRAERKRMLNPDPSPYPTKV